MKLKFALMALSMLTATPIIAGEQLTEPTQPAKKVPRICRADQNTGSIIPHRTCHSKAEWEAIDRQTNKMPDGVLNRPERGDARSVN